MDAHEPDGAARLFLAWAERVLLAARRAALPLGRGGRLSRAGLRALDGDAGEPRTAAPEFVAALMPALLSDLHLLEPRREGLVATPLARAWLAQPPGRRLLDLFRAWTGTALRCETAGSRRRRDGPQAEGLRDLPRRREACLAWLKGTAEGESLPADAPQAAAFRLMLCGPLRWLGVVEPVEDGDAGFRVTPAGACLLAGMPPPWPRAVLRPWSLDDDLALALPEPACPSLLFDLEAFADCLVRPCRYHVCAQSIARGLARGLTVSTMVQVLEQGCAAPLRQPQVRRLRAWGAQASEVSYLRGVILQTGTAEQMRLLYRQGRTRRHLARLLSPRHALVRPGAELRLARLLARRGHCGPLATLPPREPASQGHPLAGWTAAAAVYLALSARHDLPALLDAEAVDLARQALAPHEQRLVDEAVRRAMEVLAPAAPTATAAGEDGSEQPGNAAAIAGDVEWAITHGRPLRLWYDTGGTGSVMPRVVEPLLVDRRGLHTYLTAFCRERGDERVFRLDRIRRSERIDDG
ncbi:MAG TPA: WYL domain-containing protein [Anaerolineae bacterium]|nr:WYL domain-containing protein [Anaerolineae bacterium]